MAFIAAASQSALIGLSFIGISLFLIGSGFTKSCTSAFMGEQFGAGQEAERTKYYSWYYMGIQLGSIVITVASPIVFNIRPWGPCKYSAANAFAVDGGPDLRLLSRRGAVCDAGRVDVHQVRQ